MERNYINIHNNMKPNSYASFALVQAKHDEDHHLDHHRDEKEEILNSKRKKKEGTGSSNIYNNVNYGINGIKREVKLSTDPQSVAARERRHRIRERFKILQGLVPGGAKMDTVSMLEEAIQYVNFLKSQIDWLHQAILSFPCHHHHHVLASSHDHAQQLSLSSQENHEDHHLMNLQQADDQIFASIYVDQGVEKPCMSFDTISI